MPFHLASRIVLLRTLSVAVVACLLSIGFAGLASAAPVEGPQISQMNAIAGFSTATVTWVIAGVVFLLSGLVAASKSGKRVGGSADAVTTLSAVPGAQQSEHGQVAVTVR